MSPYEPTERDKDWFRRVISLIAEDGIVGFPNTMLIYRVQHKTKTWILLNPDVLQKLDSRKLHQRTTDVLAACGWKVVEAQHSSEGNGQ